MSVLKQELCTVSQSHSRNTHSRRRHRSGDSRRDARRARRAGRAVRVGSAGGRTGRRQGRGRPAAGGDAGQHPPHSPGAEGSAGNAHGRGLPLVERAPARGIQAVRQPASRAHDHPGRALRQDRSGRRPRESRRLLHRPRALRPHRRRSARGGDGHRHQHRVRAAAACSNMRSSTRSRTGARKSPSCTRPTS